MGGPLTLHPPPLEGAMGRPLTALYIDPDGLAQFFSSLMQEVTASILGPGK